MLTQLPSSVPLSLPLLTMFNFPSVSHKIGAGKELRRVLKCVVPFFSTS